MEQLHTVIVNSQSVNKAERDSATTILHTMKLDGPTTQVLLEYINNNQIPENYR